MFDGHIYRVRLVVERTSSIPGDYLPPHESLLIVETPNAEEANYFRDILLERVQQEEDGCECCDDPEDE